MQYVLPLCRLRTGTKYSLRFVSCYCLFSSFMQFFHAEDNHFLKAKAVNGGRKGVVCLGRRASEVQYIILYWMFPGTPQLTINNLVSSKLLKQQLQQDRLTDIEHWVIFSTRYHQLFAAKKSNLWNICMIHSLHNSFFISSI